MVMYFNSIQEEFEKKKWGKSNDKCFLFHMLTFELRDHTERTS